MFIDVLYSKCHSNNYHDFIFVYRFIYSVIVSFETVISTYAQQLSMDETQSFTASSLTLVAELVSNRP